MRAGVPEEERWSCQGPGHLEEIHMSTGQAGESGLSAQEVLSSVSQGGSERLRATVPVCRVNVKRRTVGNGSGRGSECWPIPWAQILPQSQTGFLFLSWRVKGNRLFRLLISLSRTSLVYWGSEEEPRDSAASHSERTHLLLDAGSY